MPNLAYLRARIEAASTSGAAAAQESPSTLSLGAIIGIAVGGAVVLFAALTPVLILLARWQDRRRADAAAIVAACCPISSSTFAAVAGDHERGASRRLRKKSVVSEHVLLYDATRAAEGTSEVGAAAGTVRRESLPVLPPVVSRPGSFNMVNPFATVVGAAPSDSSGDGAGAVVKKQRSPDKQRGYMIYQNRRKTSWIDEDALHGPSITSPKKNKNGGVTKRNPSWVASFGQGLGRSLSRRFSVRKGVAGASQFIGRSPTLPYTETARGSRAASPERSAEVEEKIAVREDVRSAHDIEAGVIPRPPQQRQNSLYQNHHVDNPNAPPNAYSRREDQTPRSRPAPTNAIMLHKSNDGKKPDNNIHNQGNTVAFDAAQQLAGSARLPMSRTVPAAPMGPRPRPGPGHRRMTQSNTDAELQAILRRTAERLQDGKQSTRRQTMMTPANASSSPSSPMKTPNGRNQASVNSPPSRGTNGRYDPAAYDSGPTSPAKSQKSAPAVMAICNEVPVELDGKSLQVPVPAATTHRQQPQSQSQTPRRHTRQMSQISQTSMISEADSLVASRRGSQHDMIQTPLSSPSRGGIVNAPLAGPSQPNPQVRPLSAVPALQRPFSGASTESSALSTVYSEEEPSIIYKSPPTISNMRATEVANQPTDPTIHMEREAMQHDAFVKRSSQMSLGGVGGPKFSPNHGASPRPLRLRRGTMRQETTYDTNANNTGATTTTVSQQQQNLKADVGATPKTAPPSFTIHAMDEVNRDPFTVATPSPPQSIPTRLSKLFSPIPAKGSSAPNSPSSHKSSRAAAREAKKDDTPTRSHPSRRRVMPPPHVLRAGAGEPSSTATTRNSYGNNEYRFPEPPSPAQSEGGLSSVYESYAYRDSSYSSYELGGGASLVNEESEDQATTARNSIVTMITAPTTAATSPTRGDSNSSNESPSRSRYRSRDALLASARQQQQQRGIPPSPAVIAEEPKPQQPSSISITVKSPSPTSTARAQRPRRHTRTSSSSSRRSGASDESSRYSQDHNNDHEGEAANAVPPLQLQLGRGLSSRRHHKRTGTTTAQHSVSINANTRYARIASTVVELRRMNSQVSCVSTTSSSATAGAVAGTGTGAEKKTKVVEASPTLPDLRGGGFSPGKSGTRAGGRNYLSLGNTVAAATPSTSTSTTTAATTVREKGSPRREEGAVSGSRGSAAAAPADRSSLRTHATKLAWSQPGAAGNRASIQSIESLGLYDEDGFLKNSPERQGFLSAAAKQV